MADDFNNQQQQQESTNYYDQNSTDPYHTDADHDGIPTIRDTNEWGYRGPNINNPKKDDGLPPATPQKEGNIENLWDILIRFDAFCTKHQNKIIPVAIGLFVIGVAIAFPPAAAGFAVGGIVGFAAYKIHKRNKAKEALAKGSSEVPPSKDDKTPNDDTVKGTEKGIGKSKEKTNDDIPLIVKPLSQRRQDRGAEHAQNATLVQAPIKTNTSKTPAPVLVTPKQPPLATRNGRKSSDIGSKGSF